MVELLVALLCFILVVVGINLFLDYIADRIIANRSLNEETKAATEKMVKELCSD
jgi:hypothetical protein